jgi:hypothetical protein
MKDFTNDIAQLNAQLQQLKMKLSEMERINSIDVVNLSTAQPVLIGRYRASAENILIILDATNGAFTVELPSAKEVQNKIFMIKKVDGLSTAVTFTAKNGEYIHETSATQTALVVADETPVNLISDRKSSWLVAG